MSLQTKRKKMKDSLINDEIVENRKKFSKGLRAMKEKAECLLQQVKVAKGSALVNPKPEKIDELEEHLEGLCTRLGNKVTLFENGTITVSVAGTEKSGKSTMLKKLTGIELPTADERCTAVCCDILYAEPGEQEYLDIIYYTTEELIAVVNEQLGYLCSDKCTWKEGRRPQLQSLVSVQSIIGCHLPMIEDMDESNRIKYGSALKSLRAIQEALKSDAGKLNSQRPDKLENLGYYVSHKTSGQGGIAPDQSLIRKIVVHTNFKGGSKALRLCDTPGVDDPNPQALKRTIKGLREETDILVLLNRPGRTPDITNDLAEFFVRLKSVDTDAPIRERTVFLVNLDRRLDPNGENARLRIEKMQGYNVFSRENVYEPMDVTDDKVLGDFMKSLNDRLIRDLPKQDRALVQKLSDEWESLKAEVKNMYDKLKNNPIGSESLEEDFDNWFSLRTNGRVEGFFDRLCKECGNLTREVQNSPDLQLVNEEVRRAFMAGHERIKKYLEEEVTVEKCKEIIRRGSDPTHESMSYLSQEMSEIVKDITDKVVMVGPFVQEQVANAIRNALADDAIADGLCPGEDAATRLQNLCDCLRQRKDKEQVAFLIHNLEEFISVGTEMTYITRYELRPALNMFDPMRWSQDRRKENNDLYQNAKRILEDSDIEDADDDIDWLEEYEDESVMPGRSEYAEKHVEFLVRICEISFKIIRAVVRPKKNDKILALMEDFLGQASQSLSTQRDCEIGWLKGLKHERNLLRIFPERAKEIMKADKNAKEYARMMENFEKALN